ncbi:MAG TPA: hypothetical protein VNO79_10910 [Actinomycetota bacterium]|nr:hypothetical protein [Actinomycetota bacterium]
MDRVNEPEPRSATVELRCAACRRGLGRWSVDEFNPDLIVGAPRPQARGRSRLVPAGPGVWEEVRSLPMRRPRFGSAIYTDGEQDVLEVVCTCRRGPQRRCVRISAQGLLRLLRRLGWPDEVEL